MRFALVDNWRDVLRHRWAIRLIAIAAVLSGCEVALPLIAGYLPIRAGTFALLSGLTTAAAFVARIVAQAKLSGGDK